MAEEAKKAKVLNLQVNLDELTFDDMEALLAFDGRLTAPLIVAFKHVIVGGIGHLKFREHVQEVVETVMEAIAAASNPESASGN
jgi:hypothetical protein